MEVQDEHGKGISCTVDKKEVFRVKTDHPVYRTPRVVGNDVLVTYYKGQTQPVPTTRPRRSVWTTSHAGTVGVRDDLPLTSTLLYRG